MPIEVMYRVFTIVFGVYVAGAIVFRVCRLFWTGQWNRHGRNDSAGADGASGSTDNHDGDGSDAGGDGGGGDGGGD